MFSRKPKEVQELIEAREHLRRIVRNRLIAGICSVEGRTTEEARRVADELLEHLTRSRELQAVEALKVVRSLLRRMDNLDSDSEEWWDEFYALRLAALESSARGRWRMGRRENRKEPNDDG